MNINLFIYLIIFFLLFLISGIIRYFYNKIEYSHTAAASIIMAIGIFSLYALKKLPFYNDLLAKLITLELCVIWLYIVFSYLACFFKGDFSIHLDNIYNQFCMGTWIAGTAVFLILFLKEFFIFYIGIVILTGFTIILWIGYIYLVVINYWKMLTSFRKLQTGIILLATVSTQSIVLLINSVFEGWIFNIVNLVLISLGYFFYLLGLFIIVQHYIRFKFRRVVIGLRNSNSIIHGALSITGLAGLFTHSLPNTIILITWILATCFFVLVEGLSLIKLILRIMMGGLLKGAFTYHVSQWTRNFTYGMYYAFTVTLFDNKLFLNPIIEVVSQYGQYVVLGFLLVEMIIFFHKKFFNPIRFIHSAK